MCSAPQLQGDPLSPGDGCREAMGKRLFGKRLTTQEGFLSGDAHLASLPPLFLFLALGGHGTPGPDKAAPGRSCSEEKTFGERLSIATRSPDGAVRPGSRQGPRRRSRQRGHSSVSFPGPSGKAGSPRPSAVPSRGLESFPDRFFGGRILKAKKGRGGDGGTGAGECVCGNRNDL